VFLVFGDFELDTQLYELRRQGERCRIEPQVFDVLAFLAEHRDRIVTKEELLDAVWRDRFVSESALTTRIKAARRAVGDDGARQAIIRTVHGRGYRFIAVAVDRPGSNHVAVRPHPIRGHLPKSRQPEFEPGVVRRDGDGWPLIGRTAQLETLARSFADPAVGGILLTGEAGVGKTRLAEECLYRAEVAGTPVVRAMGHAEGRSIPLAAVSHLLPSGITEFGADGELNRAILFHRARDSFRKGTGGRRSLLLVDDAHWLDELSLMLVSSLVSARTVFAVLTARTPSPSGPSLERLVHDGHLAPIDLQPLDADYVEALLYRVLGGPLLADSLQRLFAACRGNAGLLRQLVDAAARDGTLVERRGVWRLTGWLGGTPTLQSLVDERITGLDEEGLRAMEILAVAGSIGLEIVVGMVGDRVIDRLDEEGLIAVLDAGRRCDVSVAHPLYAEVLAARLSPLRGRRIRARLAAAVAAVGARRREDQIRMTAWQLDSGGPVEPSALVRAARLALLQQDLVLAQGFAQRAFDEARLPEALQVLCEIHFRLAEFERVEGLLGDADLTGSDERLRAALARRRATNLFYNLGLLDDSLTVLANTLVSLTDPGARRTIESHRAMILAFGGLIGDALDLTDRLADDGDGAHRFEILRARTLAMAMAGRAEEALRLSSQGRVLHATLEGGFATPGLSILLFSEATALCELGRIRDARHNIESGMVDRREATTRNWLRIATARLELLVGDADAASRAIEPVIQEARGIEPIERWGLVLLAMASLLRGDTKAARAHLDQAKAIRVDPPASVFSYDTHRAEAWMTAAIGNTSTACEQLLTAAARARRMGVLALEAALLHDVVRFGGAVAAARRLGSLARTMDGELIKLRAEHARAAAGSNVDGLARAGHDFAVLGSPLMAAECAAQAGRILRSRGDDKAAVSLHDQARDAASALSVSLHTPALVDDRLGPRLSDRELEIAGLAAAGCSSQEIAQRLYLSVRTVDNHLRHVYIKLGINRREQLRTAIVDATKSSES
jgi:DNA-binding winged helix-turn-helix (wHTH) protein/DNA-binding CsgD family transcriptional regulator